MAAARGVFIGNAVTLLRFPLIVDEVPKLLPFPGQGYNIEGEVYSVPHLGVRRFLDALEAHPNWYTRTPITVMLEGVAAEVQTYILNPRCVPRHWEDLKFISKF